MQEIRVTTTCDPCELAGRQRPGKPRRLALDGKRPRSVDLCDQCEGRLIIPVELLLAKRGVPVAKGRRQ